MLAPFTAGTGGRAAQSEPRSLEDPSGSQTTKEDRVVVAAHLVQTGYGECVGQAPRALDIEAPMGTQVAGGGKAALVASFMAQYAAVSLAELRGTNRSGRMATEPLLTQTAGGLHSVAVAAVLGDMRRRRPDGRDPAEPMSGPTAGSHAHLILAFLQTYYSSGGQDQAIDDPLRAVTAKARHGLVTVEVGRETYVIDDILMRMLEPEEGAAAHGFEPGALPDRITIDGKTRRLTKTEKYHLVGNSVPPRMVQLLAECNVRRELVARAAE